MRRIKWLDCQPSPRHPGNGVSLSNSCVRELQVTSSTHAKIEQHEELKRIVPSANRNRSASDFIILLEIWINPKSTIWLRVRNTAQDWGPPSRVNTRVTLQYRFLLSLGQNWVRLSESVQCAFWVFHSSGRINIFRVIWEQAIGTIRSYMDSDSERQQLEQLSWRLRSRRR